MISRLRAAAVATLALFTLLPSEVFAIQIAAERRLIGNPLLSPLHDRSIIHGLERRAPTQAGIPLVNVGNSLYISNITLGGTGFQVMMDTGRFVPIWLFLRWDAWLSVAPDEVRTCGSLGSPQRQTTLASNRVYNMLWALLLVRHPSLHRVVAS